ncbi:hypothetical protein LF860_13950 [Enterococcus hirae]|uniref:hypothetical protein n=1 Tax=Enterococcus hirae TaxID=1354 RepID=UPI001CF19489|nr:hypothetical protein [Enterococcus hirae]EMF0597515.1 hypothetical protein [Enterococcus hirae]MCA6767724.1 hypothetical protein [Enterococcus hirae]
MNEKIKTLVKELQQECIKEGIDAVCTLQKEGHVINMLVGDATDVAFCLAVQEKELDENLPLPAKILRAVGSAALEKTKNKGESDHTFVIDDLNDLPDIFERILRGEI